LQDNTQTYIWHCFVRRLVRDSTLVVIEHYYQIGLPIYYTNRTGDVAPEIMTQSYASEILSFQSIFTHSFRHLMRATLFLFTISFGHCT